MPIRVLFACVPAAGHVTPLLPLARELAAQGAEVVVASGPDVAASVADADLGFRRIAPGLGEWFARLAERSPGPPGAGLPPAHIERYFVPRLFGEVGLAAMREELDALTGEFRPHLVVFEPYALAAPLVARIHGVPAVQHMIGLSWEPTTIELVRDAVTPAWSAVGLRVPSSAGLHEGTTLTVCPPSLDPGPPGTAVQPMSTTARPARALPLPEPLHGLDGPLVYVTLGTSFNEPAVFATVLQGLADLPVTVLVTIGRDRSASDLGDVPGNAVVTRFLAQETVLPHCAAVVHHGGAGTALGVLAHGLPSVVLPRGADNFAFAARMAAAGAARVIGPEELGPATIRAAVRAVLDDPALRAGAERIAAEIAAMPRPEDLAPLLLESLPLRKEVP